MLGSYIKQKMRFFVAKVNLERMKKLGSGYLRPLQVRYETPKFMLPLRLGTVNANGPQDLIIYALTRNGRVETANYRTVKLPSNVDVPLYVKEDFGNFYKAMFDRAVERENMRAVFIEYAWDMGWCDPCAADPLSNKELVELGARWIGSDDDKPFRAVQGANVFVTRLHVRYDAQSLPGGPRPAWRRATARTSRAATCCAIPGRDNELRGRRQAIAPDCRSASARRPTTSRTSPAGRSPTCSPRWKQMGSRHACSEEYVAVWTSRSPHGAQRNAGRLCRRHPLPAGESSPKNLRVSRLH